MLPVEAVVHLKYTVNSFTRSLSIWVHGGRGGRGELWLRGRAMAHICVHLDRQQGVDGRRAAHLGFYGKSPKPTGVDMTAAAP